MVTKKTFSFSKPTYDSLRYEAIADLAIAHQVTRISIPKARCGLHRLKWQKVDCRIKEICKHSNLTITVYDLDENQHTRTQNEQSQEPARQ